MQITGFEIGYFCSHKNYIQNSFRVKFNVFQTSFSYPRLPV